MVSVQFGCPEARQTVPCSQIRYGECPVAELCCILHVNHIVSQPQYCGRGLTSAASVGDRVLIRAVGIRVSF